jgi:hypothetical protein
MPSTIASLVGEPAPVLPVIGAPRSPTSLLVRSQATSSACHRAGADLMPDDFDARVFALETAFRILARELNDRNLVSLGQLGDALAVEAQLVQRAGTNRRTLESTPASAGLVALARDLREAAARR